MNITRNTMSGCVFCNIPQYHLYAYTCKLKWDCGTTF